MQKELKKNIGKFNQIIKWYFENKLSEKEFKRFMEAERKAQGIKIEDISWEELHGAYLDNQGNTIV